MPKLIKKANNNYILKDGKYEIEGKFNFGDDKLQKFIDEKDLNDINLHDLFRNKGYSYKFHFEPYMTLDEDDFVIIGTTSIFLYDKVNDIMLIGFNICNINIGTVEEYKKQNNLESKLYKALNISC